MTLLFLPSGGEFIIVIIVVLLLFGAKSIPDIARVLGKGMNEFRRASDEIKREFNEHTRDIKNDVAETRSYVNKEIESAKTAVDTELGDDYDPYKLAEGEEHDDSLPEVNSTKKQNKTETADDKKIESDGPISREDIIED